MRKIFFLLFVLIVFSTFSAEAQRVVTGKVTESATGNPVPFVSIGIKGTTLGTTGDGAGNYSIYVPDETSVLVVTSVGYTAQEVYVGTADRLDVVMIPEVTTLNPVVVIGYGTRKKTEVTNAVSNVSGEDIRSMPVPSLDVALQGRATGVQINQNSGTPGGGNSIRVRGGASLSASAQPLFVIDGVPILTGDFSQNDYNGQGVDALANINPNDIESVDILKDASAAAIYGSRGANGVVIITTKKGRAGKTKINFGGYSGFQQAWKKLPMLNRTQYISLMNEALQNDLGASLNDQLQAYGLPLLEQYPTVDTDWLDEVFRTARIQNYELSASGGSEKTRYYISGSFFDQVGTLIGTNYKRFSGRLNLDHDINTKLSIGTNLTLAQSLNNRATGDNTVQGVLPNAIASIPIYPVFDENGHYANNTYSSPIGLAKESLGKERDFRVQGNLFAKYAIIPSLSARFTLGFDVLNKSEQRYLPYNFPQAPAAASFGEGNSATTRADKLLIQGELSYNKAIAEAHHVSATLVTALERNSINTMNVNGIGFPGTSFKYVSSAAVINGGGASRAENNLISFVGRGSYSFRKKYALDLAFRTDADSRFGQNYKWGYFPSVSGAWSISEEAFMKNVKFLNNLRLRIGYGIAGSNAIGNYANLTLAGGAFYLDQPGLAPSQLGNTNLRWEKQHSVNLGLDMGILESRINVTVDAFLAKTNDLLTTIPIPAQNGFSAYLSNVGSLENKGLEIGLNTVNIEGGKEGFRWKTDFNISFIRNKITALNENQPFPAGFASWNEVGHPRGMFRGFVMDGIFQSQAEVAAHAFQSPATALGDVRFKDLNGDGVVNSQDQTIIGDPNPDFTGGMTNTFSYRGIELSIFMNYSFGNDVYNAMGVYTQNMGAFLDNNTTAALDRWTPENPSNTVPRATYFDANNNLRTSSRWIEDGSFLRIKNVTLAYNFPSRLTESMKLSSLRVFVQILNLYTFTKYSGMDPEVNTFGNSNTSFGTDFYTYPQAKQFTFGLNVGF